MAICDMCQKIAEYDAQTIYGSWAFMCEQHWKEFRAHTSLGIGKGQKIDAKGKVIKGGFKNEKRSGKT